jgi:hypothetical protein
VALLARFSGIERDVHFMVKDKVAAIDGDTLRLANAVVRIYGIDAPKLDQTCTDQNGKDCTCGRDAQAKLKALVPRRAVGCTPKGRDKFNRTIVICRTSARKISARPWRARASRRIFGVSDTPAPTSRQKKMRRPPRRRPGAAPSRRPADCWQAHPRDGN